jgi:tetratricopeptide (TPR) repeat protein
VTGGMEQTRAADISEARSHTELAAWIYGASEALSVLSRRGPADRRYAIVHATGLLARHTEPADWCRTRLPVPAAASAKTADSATAVRLQVGSPAVLQLARTAMTLYCSTLPAAERPHLWAGLVSFFAGAVPQADPLLRRSQTAALFARMQLNDVPQEVIDGLLRDYEWRLETYGRDAYLTSLARTNLSIAYCQRATGTDLAEATRFCREEIDIRTRRFGARHPFTLVARNRLAHGLLTQAEGTHDRDERRALARQAYAEADQARAARDEQYGITSSSATLSRRHQGHALLLLGSPGDLKRARACLQYALAFETAHNDNTEWRGSGETHLLLTRVCLALGDHPAALDHAQNARRLLAADAPDGSHHREAVALLEELTRHSQPERHR